MASGDKQNNMLFDLRGGRRGKVVKVVYATLAVLMGLSLFLVIGGFNIAELFSNNGGTDEVAETYEKQAENIESQLVKKPGEPELLKALTRAQINAGNAQVNVEPGGERVVTTGGAQAYQEAYQSWSEYLKATDQPDAGLALLVAPMLLQLAELSSTYAQADSRIQAASDAQLIVAEDRPSVNAWTTLSFYSYFVDTELAEEARAEAKKLAAGKSERDAIDKQLDEFKENAERYNKAKAEAEKEAKEAAAAGGAGGAAGGSGLESPLNGLGGGLGE